MRFGGCSTCGAERTAGLRQGSGPLNPHRPLGERTGVGWCEQEEHSGGDQNTHSYQWKVRSSAFGDRVPEADGANAGHWALCWRKVWRKLTINNKKSFLGMVSQKLSLSPARLAVGLGWKESPSAQLRFTPKSGPPLQLWIWRFVTRLIYHQEFWTATQIRRDSALFGSFLRERNG